MKEIPLTQGHVALVDDEDYDRIVAIHWRILRCRNVEYAQGSNRTTLLMHREVLNAKIGMDVDHRDHDGLNNQKYNLRVCSHSQNLQNMRRKHISKSGFKGVTQSYNRWYASIMVNGKRMYFYGYATAKEAALAYNEAALKYFGQYANLNKI